MDFPPATMRRLSKELAELQTAQLEGIRVSFNEANITEIQAEIDGPAGTPFDGGVFKLKLQLGQEFPSAPPKGFFTTKIFHPNVSSSGEICVNVLKKDWTAETGLRQVLMVIRCLLIEPNPESALNEEAGKLLLENYEEYAKHARLMTSIHAQQAKRSGPLTTSGANATSGSAANAAGKKEGDGSASPLKKAKPEQGPTAASKPAAAISKVKKSLKRL